MSSKLALKLVKKYETRDPFRIAKELGIIILYEPLGTINGYYNKVYRQKFIHINENLTEYNKIFTAAHELGHALLHPNSNTPFMKSYTFMNIDRLEIEANEFAVNLIGN
jgi:Zn-dependent peptidase ImmA (M78 family)